MSHDEIYLEPENCADGGGSLWCEESEVCEICNAPWIKYIRADIIEAKDKEIAELNKK